MSETFIYLWYVVLTKKYYLGVHNGKDPYYTHSAVSSEEFRVIVPHSQRPIKERKEFWDKYAKGEIKGVRYRRIPKRIILEDGTDYGKMCERENKLLINRFERCWNRYYNKSLGDPRYVDMSGKNNPMFGRRGEESPHYKHGKCVGIKNNPNIQKAYDKERNQKSERKAKMAAYNINPAGKARSRKSSAKYNVKKKAETQGEGTLDAHMG